MDICLLGNAMRPIKPNRLVTGYSIAAQDLTMALLRYSTAGNIYCLQSSGQAHADLLREMMKSPGVSTDRIHIIDELDLVFHGTTSVSSVDILHSVKEDPVSLLSLRETMRKPIPLTFVFHGIVEQHLLMDTFYPLVTLPFRPYDAILCTSTTVVRTIERIFDRIETLFQGSLEQHDPAFKAMAGRFRHRIQLRHVPLGIDLSRFYRRDAHLMRKKYGIPDDAVTLLWLGRFSDVFKADLYPLLLSFARIVANRPVKKLLLVLMGSDDDGGHYRQKLEWAAEKLGIAGNIRVLRNEEVEERAELISACDIFTSPVDNLQETFGLTPVEAMACGVPQVVSDWAGYRDTVRDGETGFLVRTSWADCMNDISALDCFPSDPMRRRNLHRYLSVRSIAVDVDDYQNKLQLLIDDAALRGRMAEASVRVAREHYGLSANVYNTEQVWRELIDTAKSKPQQPSGNYLPMLDLCSDFRYYPSRCLDDSRVFEIADPDWQKRLYEIPRHHDFEQYVEEAMLPEMILRLMDARGAMRCVDIFRQFDCFSRQQIMRALMFLYKYGFARVVGTKT